LNSSKQPHAPISHNPVNNDAMNTALRPSEQLKTMHNRASAFDKSFTVSVLPVPAGPEFKQKKKKKK
jgi:hypothetical protein